MAALTGHQHVMDQGEQSSKLLGCSLRALLVIAVFTLFQTQVFAQVPDSLFTQARSTDKTLQERVVLYDEIGWQTSAFDPETAVRYADTAVQLARQAGDSALVAFALNGKSVPYIRLGAHEQGLQVLETALLADTSDLQLTAKLNSKIAIVTYALERYEDALQSNIKARRLFKAINDSVNFARTTSNIGNFYRSQNQPQKARKYLKEAEVISEKLGEPFAIMAAYRHLSQYYELIEELDSALMYAEATTGMIMQTNYVAEQASSLLNEGTILDKMDRGEEAVKKYEIALNLALQVGNLDVIKFCCMNLGIYRFNQNQFKQAKPLLLKSLQISEEQGTEEYLTDVYKFLSDIYLSEGNLDSTQHYRNQYEKVFTALFDEQQANNIAEITAKYEDAEQKATIAQQQLELAEDKATIAQQRTQNFSLIGGFLLAATGLLFWISRNRSRQKLALTQAVFEERKNGFSQMIEATELERDRISKDLHDGIGQQLTALRLSLNSLSKKVGEPHEKEVDAVLESFTKSAEDVRLISHQMMPRMLMEFGLPEAVDDLLKNSFLHSTVNYEFNHKGLTQRLDRNIEIALYRVIQELINNALKHANASSFSVQLIKSDKKIAGFVLDDGKGFDPEQLAEGHGLQNMKSRLALIDGTIDIQSGTGAGTSTSISIPIS